MNAESTTIKTHILLLFVFLACSMLIGNACSDQHAQPISTPPAEQLAEVEETGSAHMARADAIPAAYTDNCAKCHGATGEGKKTGKEKGPLITDVTTRDEDRLSTEDLAMIIDDAEAQGLSSKMPAFKSKLTQEQKQAIVAWIVALGSADQNSDYPTIAAK